MPEACAAAGGTSSVSGARLGRQRGQGDQPERRAGLRPADRLGEQPQGFAIPQDLISEGMRRRFGISGVKLRDDHRALAPVFFLVLAPVLDPLLNPLLCCALLPGHLSNPPTFIPPEQSRSMKPGVIR